MQQLCAIISNYAFTHAAVKIFGRCMVSTSEVLSQRGKRLALIGRTRYWRSFCNIDEPPDGTETDSYEFVNENGDCLFRCSMHTNVISVLAHMKG